MINKKSIWFLTLFSLILVLSVYYITMPNELLFNIEENANEVVSNVEESTILVALQVEYDNETLKEIESLQTVLTSEESTIEEKNNAFETLKTINSKRGEEESLENKIKEKYKLESFVKTKDDTIEVTINNSEHTVDLANEIIRTIQENYETKKYITVKFTS